MCSSFRGGVAPRPVPCGWSPHRNEIHLGTNIVQLAVLLSIILPIIFVAPATRRRRRALAHGSLKLADETNTLAIVGFVLAFFGGLPGIVISHVALSQIKRTNERGWELTVAGLWIGYAMAGFTILSATKS